MKYYNHKFKVDQKRELVFEYLSNKKYLTRHFQNSEKERVELVTENDNPRLMKGEEFDFLVMDKDSITTLRFEVYDLIDNEYIRLKFNLVEIIDREEGTLDDDIEMTNFLTKYIGTGFIYSIELKVEKGQIVVHEYSTVEDSNFIVKSFLKMYGIYYNLTKQKVYRQIKEEIESMDDFLV